MSAAPWCCVRVGLVAIMIAVWVVCFRAWRTTVGPGLCGEPNHIQLACLQTDPELTVLHQAWHDDAKRYAAAIRHQPSSGNIIPEQAWAYLAAGRRNDSLTVCETGFWRGMSTHLWLFANSRAVVHSFDTNFPDVSVSILRRTFGARRLHLHRGSTRSTLTTFHPQARCDILSIDASHDGWDPYDDFVALLPKLRCGSTVFFDDTFDIRAPNQSLDNNPSSLSFYNACTRSYWRAVREGLIVHAGCESFGRRWRWGRFPKGFCTGYVAADTSLGRARVRCSHDHLT